MGEGMINGGPTGLRRSAFEIGRNVRGRLVDGMCDEDADRGLGGFGLRVEEGTTIFGFGPDRRSWFIGRGMLRILVGEREGL